MPFVYILYSQKIDHYYIGSTKNDAEVRLAKHLSNFYQKDNSYSKRAKDWVIFLEIFCESEKQARLIEVHIKKMKSRKYIQDLKQYPKIIERLIEKYATV